jgi:hypothetical protein
VSEALLIPFYLDKTPVGTVWIVSHKLERKFDREDERIVKLLANFASADWQLWKARASAEKLTEELMVANEALQSQAILYEREQQRAAQTLEDTKAQLSKKVVALENELDGLKNNLKRLWFSLIRIGLAWLLSFQKSKLINPLLSRNLHVCNPAASAKANYHISLRLGPCFCGFLDDMTFTLSDFGTISTGGKQHEAPRPSAHVIQRCQQLAAHVAVGRRR